GNDKSSKQTKINQYFLAYTVIPLLLSQEKNELNVDSLDFNNVEISYSQELSPAK
ncbi:5209_t:CDS:1, partial [Racocetra fulgida]